MKALVLAAGLGTRLRPITDTVPKCLLPIAGKPLLQYHLDSLSHYGVEEVLINAHYLSGQVEDFLKVYRQHHPNIKIRTVFEPELLGSAGTLRANENFFKDEEDFFIVYGDNLTNINYGKLLDFHKQRQGIATIACYLEQNPKAKGVVSFDQNRQISGFKEKPQDHPGHPDYASGGVYILNKKVFGHIQHFQEKPLDFGSHLFPHFLALGLPMHVYLMNEFLLDIGTLENYNKAQEIIKQIKF